MELAAKLIGEHFGSQGSELLVGGWQAQELAERYQTPVFVYDRTVAEKKWEALRAALPPKFEICYSIKANPQPAFLHLFLSKGCGLETASAGELLQALESGCKPEKILFAGPGKSEVELELALTKGIGEVHAESLTEIKRIGNIARRLGRKAPVALRVNPSGEAQGGAMRMGGKPAPFGVDEESLYEALERIAADSEIEFRGIHLFTGTQILQHEILLAQYRRGIEIARRAAQRIGTHLRTLDFGGGLGIPYFANEHPLDLDCLRQGLSELMGSLEGDEVFEQTRFFVEPGRFLVGECGIYLAKVTDIKVSRGKKFLILDGGMNHHLAASGNLGQTIKRNYPIAIANKLGATAHETVDVVGPLCTPLDVLGRNVILPTAELGDLVTIFQSGAYARSASPLAFLSHPTPAEVWVERGEHRLIRKRGEIGDLTRDTCGLELTATR